MSIIVRSNAEANRIGALVPDRGFKNLIINGGFDIWQRGTALVTLSNEYSADRWKSTNTGIKVGLSNNAPDGFNYSAFIDASLSGGQKGIVRQPIELIESGKAGQFKTGNSYILSFWATATLGHDMKVSVRFVDSVGSTTNAVEHLSEIAGTSSATDVWQKYETTFTIAGAPNSTNIALEVTIFDDAVDSIIKLTGVQLEEGSVATPFEQRPIGLELSLCQRYYQSKQIQYSAYRPDANPPFSNSFTIVEKRVTPSITVGSYSNGSGGLTALTFLPNISEIIANASGSTSTGTTIGITADIKIDAEL